jgi:hypothetical protein
MFDRLLMSDPIYIGFFLYDVTDTGDTTIYDRDGLSHRWDWSKERNSYSIVIKADGTVYTTISARLKMV